MKFACQEINKTFIFPISQVDPADYFREEFQPDEHYHHNAAGIGGGTRKHYTPTLFERYLNRPKAAIFNDISVVEVS
jgi:hypothetical protein